MNYVVLNENRYAVQVFSPRGGKDVSGAVQVDCPPPDKAFYTLKENYQDFSGAEQWECNDDTYRELLLEQAIKLINANTEANINAGIEINGVQVPLSPQDQSNFGIDHGIRDTLTYPYQVRVDNGTYVSVNSAEEFDQFFMAGRNYVRQCIEAGYAAKDAAAAMTITELTEYINNNGG